MELSSFIVIVYENRVYYVCQKGFYIIRCMHKKWVIFIVVVVIASLIALLSRVVDFSPSAVDPSSKTDDGGDVTEETVVRITNVSKYAISPGMLVIHGPNFSMNIFRRYVSAEYELLAEVGDPSTLISSLKDLPGVYYAFRVSSLRSEGGSAGFTIPPMGFDTLVSYIAMIVPTNDGVVWTDGFPLYNSNGGQQVGGTFAQILDMGTEQNSPIGSGLAGGQPEYSRGAENVTNGVATKELSDYHPQFYDDPAISESIVRIDLNS